MIFDGITLSLLNYEINKTIVPAQFTDIIQIDKLSILFIFKKNRDLHKIFFSIKPDQMSLFISEDIIPKTDYTTQFSNNLKILLQGGVLTNSEQIDFDRIIKFNFQIFQKFGPAVNYHLIIEFMGKHSNAILIDEDGYIKNTLKQIGAEQNRYREIKPGIIYKEPPGQDKINPLKVSKEEFFKLVEEVNLLSKPIFLYQFLADNFQGISLKRAKEMVCLFNLPPTVLITEYIPEQIDVLWKNFVNFREIIIRHQIRPLLLNRLDGRSKDCTLFSTKERSESEYIPFNSLSAFLESYYLTINRDEEKLQLYNSMHNILKKEKDKLEETEQFLTLEIAEIRDAEQYKEKGELILANLWNIPDNQKYISITDYSQPGYPVIKLELDPGLSPLVNAQQFFHRYKKLTLNRSRVEKQITENHNSQKQLQMFLSQLENANDSLQDLNTLYHKLVQSGYIKEKKERKQKNTKKNIPNIKKYISLDGWTIMVGKNSRQNEYLLRHLTSGNDFWLHHQDKPGAYVIIKNHQNLPTPPPETLNFAARLTAFYSKVKDNENSQIVYTMRKYVRKQKGAKMGKVIYSQEKIITVILNYEEIKNELKKYAQSEGK